MSEASRRAAEHALGPWAERQVESTPETREELIRNVDNAIARAVEGERARVLQYLASQGWIRDDMLTVISAALRAPAGCLDEDKELGPCGRCAYCCPRALGA